MSDLDTSGWTPLGTTGNTAFFDIEPGLIAVVPNKGATDDLLSARENIAFVVNDLCRARGRRAVILVFFDRLASQDTAARKVYGNSDPTVILGAALIGGSLLGRTIAKFFLNISRPPIPIKLCGDLDDALEWARQTYRDAP